MRRRYHIIHSNAHADVCIIIAIIIQTGQHNQSKVVCVLGGKDIWCMEKRSKSRGQGGCTLSIGAESGLSL